MWTIGAGSWTTPSTTSSPEFWSVSLVDPAGNTTLFSQQTSRAETESKIALSPYSKDLAADLPDITVTAPN